MKYTPKYLHKGFTLIELLVVISIIALLSSVVLASLSSARDRAKIAAAIEFASTNYHAFGAGALFYYNFDTGSGNPVNQGSETTFQEQTVGTINYTAGDTPTGSGYSLKLSSSGNGFWSYTTGPSITLSAFTISIWIKNPSSSWTGPIVYGGSGAPNNCAGRVFNLQVINNSDILFGSAPTWNFATGFTLTPDQWHNITYSYNPGVGYIMYVDGNKIPSSNITGPTTIGYTAVNGVNIGGMDCGSPSGFAGNIDDFALYTEALTAQKIENLYTLGALKHSVALK